MKKLTKTIPVLLSSLFLLSVGSLNVSAAVKYVNNTGKATVVCGTYRKTFTAKKYFNNFSMALNAALEAAGKKATANKTARVTVQKGHYSLDRTIKVYSNTVLDATGSYFRYYGNLLRNGFDGKKSAGYGYTSAYNITIKGGEWEQLIDFKYAGSSDTTKMHSTFRFAHMTNLKVKEASFKNNYNCHDIEIAGVSDAKIYNNNFYNTKSVNGIDNDGGRESLQIDLNDSEAMPYFPAYDDTPCKNIEIYKNRFKNKFRAIGSHHAVLGLNFDNISVHHNSMDSIAGMCVYAIYWTNSKIYSNTMTNVGLGVDMRNMTTGSGYNFYNKKNLTADESNSFVASSYNYIYDNNIHIREKDDILVRECGIRVLGEHCAEDDNVTGTKSGTYKVYNVHIGVDESKKPLPNTISGNVAVGIHLNYGVNCVVKYNSVDLKNSIASSANGFEIKACENTVVDFNSIYNANRSDSVGINLTVPASGFGNANVSASKNLIDNVSSVGIRVNKGTATGLYSNIIKNCSGKAIEIKDALETVAEYNTLSASNYGIYVSGKTSSLSMSDNSVVLPKQGVYVASADSIFADENRITAKSNGVFLNNVNSAVFSDNVIDSSGYGIRLSADCLSTSITENNIRSNNENIYLNGSASALTDRKTLLISGNSFNTSDDKAEVKVVYDNVDLKAYTNFRSDGSEVLYRVKPNTDSRYTNLYGELTLDNLTKETTDDGDVLTYSSPDKGVNYSIERGEELLSDTTEQTFTAPAAEAAVYTVTPFMPCGIITVFGIPMTV